MLIFCLDNEKTDNDGNDEKFRKFSFGHAYKHTNSTFILYLYNYIYRPSCKQTVYTMTSG